MTKTKKSMYVENLDFKNEAYEALIMVSDVQKAVCWCLSKTSGKKTTVKIIIFNNF